MIVIRDLIHQMKHGDFHKARHEARNNDLDAGRSSRSSIRRRIRPTSGTATGFWVTWAAMQRRQVADYLMERLLREKTARMRKQTLMEAMFIEGPWNPANAIAALADKNRDVGTLRSGLGACTDPRAEATLIDIVAGDADADPAATRHAAEGLARNGTDRCAESLVSLVRRLPCNGYHEVTISAALVGLARLGRPDALPLAAAGLRGWRYNFANWARMLYVSQFGDQRHIDLVIDRLKSTVQRPKRQNLATP